MSKNNKSIGVWQLFMLLISVLALLMLALQIWVPLTVEIRLALRNVDNVICAFFLADFFWQLYITRPFTAYLKWGWLDLLASIPMIPALRVARLARIARILRVLRGARASKHMLRLLLLHRAKNTFWAVGLGSVVLIMFSAVAIVSVEPTLSPRDAFWWSLFTLITGEYGDFYPATTEGRVITALLMTAGVALFGTFTASVASFFLEEDQEQDEHRDNLILEKIEMLSKDLEELKTQLNGENDGVHPEKSS
jgi:voltage-gated potassium channel